MNYPPPRHWATVGAEGVRSAFLDHRAMQDRAAATRRQEEEDRRRRELGGLDLAMNPRLRDVTGVPETPRPPRPSVLEGAEFGSVPPPYGAPPLIFANASEGLRSKQLGPVATESPTLGSGLGAGIGAVVRAARSSTPLLDRWRDVPPRRPRHEVDGRTYEILPAPEYDPRADPQILRESEMERLGLGRYTPERPPVLRGAGGREFPDTPVGRAEYQAWENANRPPGGSLAQERLHANDERTRTHQEAEGNASVWAQSGRFTLGQLSQLLRAQHNLTPGDANRIAQRAMTDADTVGQRGRDEAQRPFTRALGWDPVNDFERALVDALVEGQTPDEILAEMEAAGQPPEAIRSARTKLAPLMTRFR